jgi:hypothetical protein
MNADLATVPATQLPAANPVTPTPTSHPRSDYWLALLEGRR